MLGERVYICAWHGIQCSWMTHYDRSNPFTLEETTAWFRLKYPSSPWSQFSPFFLWTIHFGSRRPSVRNNVSNKLAHALFFQNAFTSWVHRASFLKLCFWSTAIAGPVLSPAQGAALSSQCFFLSNSWNVRGCAVRTHKEMTTCTWLSWQM